MKRKITGAILVSLSLGFLWQALAVDQGCLSFCDAIFKECKALISRRLNGTQRAQAERGCVESWLRCQNSCR
jgi:hypothetical protein